MDQVCAYILIHTHVNMLYVVGLYYVPCVCMCVCMCTCRSDEVKRVLYAEEESGSLTSLSAGSPGASLEDVRDGNFGVRANGGALSAGQDERGEGDEQQLLITVPSPFNDDQGCFSGLCDDLAEECELETETEVDVSTSDKHSGMRRAVDGVGEGDEGGEDRSWVCDNPFDRPSSSS